MAGNIELFKYKVGASVVVARREGLLVPLIP